MISETKQRKKYSKTKTSRKVKDKDSFNVVQLHRSKQEPSEKVLTIVLIMLRIATKILGVVLPLLFMFIGSIKLFPIIPALFQEMQMNFIRYTHVCPTVLFGYVPDPHTYRICVGVWEVCAGLGALVGPLDVKRMSSVTLMVIMCGAALTHALMQEYSMIVNPSVFGFLWLYLYFHYGKKMKQE